MINNRYDLGCKTFIGEMTTGSILIVNYKSIQNKYILYIVFDLIFSENIIFENIVYT